MSLASILDGRFGDIAYDWSRISFCSNKLIDISPLRDGDISIQTLFVPDNVTKYNGGQIDNIRLPTTNNKLTEDYIALAETKYALLNKGEPAN